MTYIEDIALRIRGHVSSHEVPQGDVDGLFLIYAALVLAKGESVTARDVHNAWAAWMVQQHSSHTSIRPYDELPSDTRREDDPFVAALRATARELEISAKQD